MIWCFTWFLRWWTRWRFLVRSWEIRPRRYRASVQRARSRSSSPRPYSSFPTSERSKANRHLTRVLRIDKHFLLQQFQNLFILYKYFDIVFPDLRTAYFYNIDVFRNLFQNAFIWLPFDPSRIAALTSWAPSPPVSLVVLANSCWPTSTLWTKQIIQIFVIFSCLIKQGQTQIA